MSATLANSSSGRRSPPELSDEEARRRGDGRSVRHRPCGTNADRDGRSVAAGGGSGDQQDEADSLNLIPIGKLLGEPNEVRGEVSRAFRLELGLETYMTDLYRIPKWYIELRDVDDIEASPRRGVMLVVTPIITSPDDCALTNMTMNREGRLTMVNVTVCPSGFFGSLPRWFRNQLEARASELPRERRYYDGDGNFDFSRISIDYFETAWARNIAHHMSNDATIFVRMDDLTKTRDWIGRRNL